VVGVDPRQRTPGPNFLAASLLVIMTAALPSESGEELPGVIDQLICGKALFDCLAVERRI